MSILISIQDFHNNTDVMIFVDIDKRIITWIPRDLYSFLIHNRVSAAFAFGGHDLLCDVFNGLGFKIKASIVIPAKTTYSVFQDISVTVPINSRLEYYYPLRPDQPIENGKKVVIFSPPFEILTGERVHQFIGARYRVDESTYTDLPDLERITRQIIFVQSLINQKFCFNLFLNLPMFISGDSDELSRLNFVDEKFIFSIYRDYTPIKIGKMAVLANLNETKNILNAVIRK